MASADPALPESQGDQGEGPWVFPSDFPIKIMGRNVEGFADAIGAVVREHAPDFDPAAMELRVSSARSYLSCTCTVRAVSRAQLDALYRALTRHPLVKVVL